MLGSRFESSAPPSVASSWFGGLSIGLMRLHQARARVCIGRAVSAAPAASRKGRHHSENQFTERLGRPVSSCVGKPDGAMGFVGRSVLCKAWASVSIGHFGLVAG